MHKRALGAAAVTGVAALALSACGGSSPTTPSNTGGASGAASTTTGQPETPSGTAAPVRDANVDRFVQLLREFAVNTQFIVVTHNKKTMEVADYLYGVTMEEPGVSKLVSVRWNRERPAEADAPPPEELEPASP